MANKLKKMALTSVDLTRRGANQMADICLFKSVVTPEDAESPSESEKNIFKRFIQWLRENPEEGDVEPDDPIEKSDPAEVYKSAIVESIHSILTDESLSQDDRNELIEKSIGQYHEKMMELAHESHVEPEAPVVTEKSVPEYDEIEEVAAKKA